MSSWQAVLFDLDDTLYDERSFVDGGFRAVGRFLAPRLGGSVRSIASRLGELHERDGRGRLFDTILTESGHGADEDLVLATVLVYRTHRPRIVPFPGVVETIDILRGAGMATGLLSDGLASVQHRKLAGLRDIARRLDIVVMTDELRPGNAKPSPVPFRVACLTLGVDPARTVYVANDPRKDFEGARASGLATIRTGRSPDEGGPSRIGHEGSIDADVVVEEFAWIAPLLLTPSPRWHSDRGSPG